MAERQLQGVIKLRADTTQAEKDVQDFSQKVAPASSPAATGVASRFAQELRQQLQARLVGFIHRLGPLGAAAVRTATAIRAEGAEGGHRPGELGAAEGPSRGRRTSSAGSAIVQTGATAAGAVPTRGSGAALAATVAGGGSGAAGAALAGAGGGGAGAGAAAAGAGAAGAAGAAATGIGAALLVVASIGLIVAAFLKGLQVLNRTILSHSRELSTASGKVAVSMAQFDVQMFILKKRIGDELAPEIKRFTQELSGLAKDVLPRLAPLFKDIIDSATGATAALRKIAPPVIEGAGKTKTAFMWLLGLPRKLENFLEDLVGFDNPARRISEKLPKGTGVGDNSNRPISEKLPANAFPDKKDIRDLTDALNRNTDAQNRNAERERLAASPGESITSPFDRVIRDEQARLEKLRQEAAQKQVSFFDFSIDRTKLSP